FLEPEGRDTPEIYVQGFSTGLPERLQLELLHTLPGLENCVMLRPAYAVEYDYAVPTQLSKSLESQKIKSLFFAGQINGSSGYEEAAAQGLIAGVNAANNALKLDPFIVGRETGYIGVLIDDLTTKGVTEPYRMFTSRAEYRLLFNHGSSELRYLPLVRNTSLVTAYRRRMIENKSKIIYEWVEKFNSIKTTSNKTYGDLLRMGSNFNFPSNFNNLSLNVQNEVIYRVKYEGYLKRELLSIEKMKDIEKMAIPSDFNFDGIPGLRTESIEKLREVSPSTIGQASRIPGVNPSDLNVLTVMIKKRKR
ncbi:MAG: tRNA uridine-5-carboxymethylaminomethyl(34) synthesis enzyme MnmG, partial [Verrucomicrobia bacterium TMED44]